MTKKEKLAQIKDNLDPNNKTHAEVARVLSQMQVIKGEDGYTPIKGVDYFTKDELTEINTNIQKKINEFGKGLKGDKGDSIIGPEGRPGRDGRTPIKGTDYWTPNDRLQIIDSVLRLVPKAKDGISPKIEDIVSRVTLEVQKKPVHINDIKGTEKLIEFLKLGGFRGGGGSSSGGSVGPGTINEIAYFNTTTTIASLTTATYPSLTELSYVKGVTSSIQTQLNSKGTGTVTAVSIATANGFSGSSSGGTTPALTIVAGAITPTSVNGLTISTTTGTFTLTNLKTLAVTNTLTLSGTDSTIMTFPTTSATIARTDAANTFIGASTASAWVLTSPTITTKISPTSNDGAPLGDTTHQFSDLFLAEGGVINWDNGDITLTQTGDVLSLQGGSLGIGGSAVYPLDVSAAAVSNAFARFGTVFCVSAVPEATATGYGAFARAAGTEVGLYSYNSDIGLYAGGVTNPRFYITGSNGNIGVGYNAVDPSGKFGVLSTTEQLRLAYDATHYFSTTVASTGSTTFAVTGTSPVFTFSQDITLPKLTTTSTIELGHASDTTITRVSAGVISVEGVRVITDASTTSGKILKNNGTTFIASTETYAAPGTSGNVMTSDGTNWTSAAVASPTSKNGTTTYDTSTASGNQTIAHGLGRTPKNVKLDGVCIVAAQFTISHGGYDGTNNAVVYGNTAANTSNNNTTTAIILGQTANNQAGSVTVDSTNITIAWTKTGTPTGTAFIFWSVF